MTDSSQWDHERDGDLGKAHDHDALARLRAAKPATKLAIHPAKTVEWATPEWLFRQLDREFDFTVDAAASDELHWHERYWTKDDSALRHDWAGARVL